MSGMSRYALSSAARASASWASRSACSGSPCRDRHPGADRQRRRQHQPVVVETASSAQRRAAARSRSASAASAFQMRCNAAVPPLTTIMCWRAASRASCAAAPSPAARAAHPHRCVPDCRAPSAKLRAALEGRLGRRPGRGHLTLVCECHALAPEAESPCRSRREPPRPRPPPRRIVRRLRPNRRCHHLRHPEVKATQTRVEPVADRVGEVASFLGGRAHRDRVTRDVGAAAPAGRGSGSASTDRPRHGPGRSPRRSMPGPPRRYSSWPAINPQAVSARASRAGSSTSRAIASACSA